jgi:guanylate kinase
MRVTETEGKEYFFRTLPQFLQMVDEGRFLEHQNVYPDTTMEPRLYGTLWSEIDRVEKVEDKIPMLEVDLHGGVRVREVYGDRVKLIFIMPRSIEDLVEQIKARDPSLPPDLEARMIRAKQEMEEAHDVCDYIVHNHPPTIEPAAAKVEQIIHEILLQHQVLV